MKSILAGELAGLLDSSICGLIFDLGFLKIVFQTRSRHRIEELKTEKSTLVAYDLDSTKGCPRMRLCG